MSEPVELINQKNPEFFLQLEHVRKQYFHSLIQTFFILFGITIFIFILYTLLHVELVYYFITFIASVVIFLMFYSKKADAYKYEFKSEVIPQLIKILAPDADLKYNPDDGISEDEFDECGLFSKPDRYSSKDCVEGYIGKTHIRFSLVHAEEERESTSTDKDGHTHTDTYYVTIFSGILFSADFNKHFSGKTYVLKKSFLFRRGRVKLEDPRFNEKFKVYSTNQIEARYILTPNFMEKIIALSEKIDDIELSFCNERVYIAIPASYNLFEPSFLSPPDKDDAVYNATRYLSLVLGVTDELGLNTRIWTKY